MTARTLLSLFIFPSTTLRPRKKSPVGLLVSCLVVCAVAVGCGPGEEEFCGLSSALPEETEVSDGNVTADFTTSDGSEEPFIQRGTWGPGPSGSIEAGLLSIIIARDESGTEVGDLVERGAFPICIPLRDRSETSGLANYVEGGFVTNDTATGNLSILGREGDSIVGRFEALLENSQGQDLAFTDGAFRVPQR